METTGAAPAPTLAAVALPLATIFTFQTLFTMAAYSISVIAPDAASDMGLAPESVGFLSATLYLAAMVSGLGSAALLGRLGTTRTFQVLAGVIGLGCLSLAATGPWLAFLGALLIGLGTGPMNPAGSHVLSRVAPPRWQPLVFSLKQCGTPAGGMLAGALLPPLALAYDWRLALCLIPVSAVLLILLAPWGGLSHAPSRETGRTPSAPAAGPRMAFILSALRSALATPALRSVVLMGTCLGACQLAIASYYVVFLWSQVKMTPIAAGQVFVVFHISGIVARVVLGAVAERVVRTRHLLAGLGVVMGLATGAAVGFDAKSELSTILVVTVLIGASGNGWVGLFFSELARLAPAGEAASVTGGGQFVMYTGIVAGPLVLGLILEATGRYDVAFTVFAALALATAAMPLLAGSARAGRHAR